MPASDCAAISVTEVTEVTDEASFKCVPASDCSALSVSGLECDNNKKKGNQELALYCIYPYNPDCAIRASNCFPAYDHMLLKSQELVGAFIFRWRCANRVRFDFRVALCNSRQVTFQMGAGPE